MPYLAILVLRPLIWVTSSWFCLTIIAGLLFWLAITNKRLPWVQVGLVLLMGLYVFIRRYPVLHHNVELNPDESQLLAQAITLWHHAIYWRFVDGATMGPLSSYMVAIPALFGIPLDYTAARWLGFSCTLVALLTTYLALNNLFSRRAASLALLPIVLFAGYTQYADFVHNTNEQLSLALIGICLWLFSYLIRHQLFSRYSLLFMVSFTASLVPFAKLQGTPLALVIVAATFVKLWQYRGQLPITTFRRALAGLLTGGIVFPAIFIGLTFYYGVFTDFKQFYLLSNITYGSGNSFWINTGHFFLLVGRAEDFICFLIPTAGLLIMAGLWPTRDWYSPPKLFFCLALLLASLYAIIKPGNLFSHYLLYLIVPINLVNAYLIEAIRLPPLRFSAGFIALTFLPFLINDVLLRYHHQPFSPYLLFNQEMEQSDVAKETLKYTHSGEDLVVWGWMPRYNVETQMPQGVAENHVIRCVFGDSAMQRLHRQRYMQNITRSKPAVFIDAVGENCVWLTDRSRFGHETFPELNAYVSKYYRYTREVNHTRIYVRNDRYEAITAQKPPVYNPVVQRSSDLQK